MMNLLPHTYKEEIYREHQWRFLEVAGSTASILLGIGLVLLSPSALFLVYETSSVRDALEVAKNQHAALLRDVTTQSLLAEVRRELDLVKPPVDRELGLAPLTRTLLSRRTAGVTMTTISFSRIAGDTAKRATFDIAGVADTRAALLGLIASLESEPLFGKVDSPISNLVKDKDLPYTIHIDVK